MIYLLVTVIIVGIIVIAYSIMNIRCKLIERKWKRDSMIQRAMAVSDPTADARAAGEHIKQNCGSVFQFGKRVDDSLLGVFYEEDIRVERLSDLDSALSSFLHEGKDGEWTSGGEPGIIYKPTE